MKFFARHTFIIVILILLCGCETQQDINEIDTDILVSKIEPAIEDKSDIVQPSTNEVKTFSEEFGLLIGDQILGLGNKDGKFPWGTELVKENSEIWSSDGFDVFEIACEDGTFLSGLRNENIEDEIDGYLLQIITSNSSHKTHRGAYVGMSKDEFVDIYPEAKHRETFGIDGAYDYVFIADDAFIQIIFWFENDEIYSIGIIDSIDGYI